MWWIERWKDNSRRRAAEDLGQWLGSLRSLLETCQGAFRQGGIPSDIGVTLDRIDRELMRFRNHASAIRRPLRRADSALGERLEAATEQVYHLRNQTCAYLIRWLAVQQRDPLAADRGIEQRRAMEAALLAASQTASQLALSADSLDDECQAWISRWSGESRPGR